MGPVGLELTLQLLVNLTLNGTTCRSVDIHLLYGP